MKILVVSLGFPDSKNYSMASKFVFVECRGYARASGMVRVLTPHRYNAEERETIVDGIDVVRFPYFFPKKWQLLRKVNKPIYNHLSILELLQYPFLIFFFAINIMRHARWADIIHCQWTNTALLALPAKWFLGSKIVTTPRGSDIRLLPKWINQFIFKQIDGVIDCYGDQQWSIDLKEKFDANFIKLPLIVNLEDKEKIPDDMGKILLRKPNTFKIVYIGRLERNILKLFGLCAQTLIEAANLLKEEGRDFHIFYIGEGKEVKKQMESKVQEMNLDSNISFLGLKEEVEDYIYFADLGAGGSAFSTVSQEISVYSKPQILTEGFDNVNVPWRDKENALFHEHNNPESLANTIRFAMDHPNELEEIGKKANVIISRYAQPLEIGGKMYLDKFQAIIQGEQDNK